METAQRSGTSQLALVELFVRGANLLSLLHALTCSVVTQTGQRVFSSHAKLIHLNVTMLQAESPAKGLVLRQSSMSHNTSVS